MNNIIVYGIPNCDITKKAIAWLKKNNIEFYFHDYKKSGITTSRLNSWAKEKSWEMILNKRGTTWKKIPPEIQRTITGQKAAVQLMLEHNSLIKRPVIAINDRILIGYDEAGYNDILLNP